MEPLENFRAVVAEMRDQSAELRQLAAKLQEELKGQETRLSVDYFDDTIVIAYRGIVAVYWRLANEELACFPTAWHRRTYTAASVARAREITIRLIFEFVRDRSSASMRRACG
jgi:hypothetical protein